MSMMPSYQLPIEHRAIIRVVLRRMVCLGIIFCIALVITILVDGGVV